MKVAVRSSQHSPMFGQRASSQTEWRFHSFIRLFRRRYCGPPGARTLSHDGLGESVGRNGSRRGKGTPIASILGNSSAALWHIFSQAANGGRAAATSRHVSRSSLGEGLVPKGGLEPPRVAPHAPQTCASANSATSAPAKSK